MTQKYIRHEKIGFVIWPRTDELWHAHVADAVRRRKPGAILSAGFVTFTDGVVHCHGMSESLGIASRPDDNAALAAQLGLTAAK